MLGEGLAGPWGSTHDEAAAASTDAILVESGLVLQRKATELTEVYTQIGNTK